MGWGRSQSAQADFVMIARGFSLRAMQGTVLCQVWPSHTGNVGTITPAGRLYRRPATARPYNTSSPGTRRRQS